MSSVPVARGIQLDEPGPARLVTLAERVVQRRARVPDVRRELLAPVDVPEGHVVYPGEGLERNDVEAALLDVALQMRRRRDPRGARHRDGARGGGASRLAEPGGVDADGDRLRDAGGEFGVTTGRPRRTGWFDALVVEGVEGGLPQ